MADDHELEIQCAFAFCVAAHTAAGNVRKWTGDDYYHHPIEVVSILMNSGLNDTDLLCAAYLHDVVEDANIPKEKIYLLFGQDVGRIVEEVTDVYDDPVRGNRATRKKLEAERLWTVSTKAQNLKLADFISNFPSIAFHDPGFAVVYAREKEYVLSGFRDNVDPDLLARCRSILDDFYSSKPEKV